MTTASEHADPGGHRPAGGREGAAPVALTIDDLGTPLHTVQFCVVDLETTGGRADDLGITEVGAVRVRGGEVTGEFQTLVNPARPIPAYISVLTGITDGDVAAAPRIDSVLPAFLEFSHGCVLVAHNAPYDMSYLKQAAAALGYPWAPLAVIDTARLSRAVLGKDEVANHKLATLAQHFRAAVTPSHRALDDARATVDVLHGLIGRVGSLGVTTLEELASYSSKVPQHQRRKRHLANGLPSAPGVYLFHGPDGETLYVGTSKNIRTRVASYFTASEQRGRIREMVALASGVTPLVCASPLEAAVRELRLIAERKPRYNRRSRHPERGRWLKLTTDGAPRLSLVRTPKDDRGAGAVYLGPMSTRTAAVITDVLTAALSLRTCTERLSVSRSRTPCSLADMGRCCAPCLGGSHFVSYLEVSDRARVALRERTEAVVSPTMVRIRELSDQQRFEEAGQLLEALRVFVRVADRTEQRQALTDAGEVVAAERVDASWVVHVIRHGALAGAVRGAAGTDLDAAVGAARATASQVELPAGCGPAALTEETDLLLNWLDQPTVRLIDVSGQWHRTREGPGGWLSGLGRSARNDSVPTTAPCAPRGTEPAVDLCVSAVGYGSRLARQVHPGLQQAQRPA